MRKNTVREGMKRAAGVLAAAVMVLMTFPVALAEEDPLAYLYEESEARQGASLGAYQDYLKQYAEADRPETEIPVELSAFSVGQDTPAPERQTDY